MKRSLYLTLIFLAAFHCICAQIPESEREITASSTLPPSSSSTFTPDNLMDGTPDSWSEGAKGSGVGESIEFFLKYPDYLDYVMIKNGFGNEKYWSANNRIRELRIVSESGASRLITLEDTPGMRVYGTIKLIEDAHGDLQEGEPLYGKQFIFSIESVYKGDRWDDACISEIAFNRWKIGDFSMEEEYVNKNLFRIFLDGVFGPSGELYYESDFSGLLPVNIRDGYFFREITSGDGTSGHVEYQVFLTLDGMEPLMFTSKYLTFMAEVHSDRKKSKARSDEEPVWEEQEALSFSFFLFDSDAEQFRELTDTERIALFDVAPVERLSSLTGNTVKSEDIWIVCGSSPYSLKVFYPATTTDTTVELDYTWEGERFKIAQPAMNHSPDLP